MIALVPIPDVAAAIADESRAALRSGLDSASNYHPSVQRT
jgi:hypothetical protein